MLNILTYDCGQEYELDDYNILIADDGIVDTDEQAREVITNFLKDFYEINRLPDSTLNDIRQYRLSDGNTAIFYVEDEYHDKEYMQMVHVEVSWQYIDVYKGEGL